MTVVPEPARNAQPRPFAHSVSVFGSRRVAAAWLALVASALAACGGGSGGGGPRIEAPQPVNAAPVADAGPDIAAAVGDTVQLDGSGSSDADGDTLGYAWTLIVRPNGSGASLEGGDSVSPTLVIDVPGTYTIE